MTSSIYLVTWTSHFGDERIQRTEIFSTMERAKAWEESIHREMCYESANLIKIVEYKINRPGSADLSVRIK